LRQTSRRRDDGATFAILASHAAETLTLKPSWPTTAHSPTLHGNEVLEGVTLDPFGISTFKVTGSEPAAPAADGRP
jgi:hypothetical protein